MGTHSDDPSEQELSETDQNENDLSLYLERASRMSDMEIPLSSIQESPTKGSRWSDRRHASPTEVVAVIVLVIQLCALVWGAAKLSAAVDTLQTSVNAMQIDMRTVSENLQALTTDVRILQARDGKRP